jgi:hypothetical protein
LKGDCSSEHGKEFTFSNIGPTGTNAASLECCDDRFSGAINGPELGGSRTVWLVAGLRTHF